MSAADEELTHVEPEDDVKMTIWEHIGELRKRLARAAGGLVVGACVCWAFREKMLAWVTTPYVTACMIGHCGVVACQRRCVSAWGNSTTPPRPISSFSWPSSM